MDNDDDGVIGNDKDGAHGFSLVRHNFLTWDSSNDNSGSDGGEVDNVILPLSRLGTTEQGIKLISGVSVDASEHDDDDVKYGSLGGHRDQSAREFSDVEKGDGGERRGGHSDTALSLSAPWSLLLNRHKKRCRTNSAGSEGSIKGSHKNEQIDDCNCNTSVPKPIRSTPASQEVDTAHKSTSFSVVNSTTAENNNCMSTAIRSRPRSAVHRQFSLGDYALVLNNEMYTDGVNSKNLVNRYGFPEWDTEMIISPERQQGPYVYVLSKVVSVHLGGDAQNYYTVRREDTLDHQRADAQHMEPITNQTGIDAAKIAAKKKWNIVQDEVCIGGIGNTTSRFVGFWSLRPRLDTMTKFVRICQRRLGRGYQKAKQQTDACLNGKRPYSIACQFSGVNILVVCSIWYIVIDPVRLAFLPSSMDYNFAVVSAIVWFVLVLELLVEVLLRPSGYYALIRSEKAFLPSTVRYISTFHLISEMISLVFFIPEFMCIFGSNSCRERNPFSLANACLMSLYGPDRLHAFYGFAFITMLRLRIFGLVRHWTNMWINNTFIRVRGEDGEWRVERGKGFFVPQQFTIVQNFDSEVAMNETESHRIAPRGITNQTQMPCITEDDHVTNTTRIGAALLVTNARRSLIFVFLIGLLNLFPVLFKDYGGTNHRPQSSAVLLQTDNLALNDTSYETCSQLHDTVVSWTKTNLFHKSQLYVLRFHLKPSRCAFQKLPDGSDAGMFNATLCRSSATIEWCSTVFQTDCQDFCLSFVPLNKEERIDYLEEVYGVRQSVLLDATVSQPGTYSLRNGDVVSADFSVHLLFNEATSVQLSAIYIFAVQLGMTLFVLFGLSVLRHDAGRLVLGPLRRILKIVAFYAKNPLSPPPQRGEGEVMSFQKNKAFHYISDEDTSDGQLGQFETEQLITAVTTTTDLLRKCWGVAGAGIISSNLASEEGGGLTNYFNPTVPGKAVYAVFAFVSIDKFQRHLHALKGDIMILINDIAAVLHEEVFRWGYEDSGQCNKNLGNAFLMVYRIGSVSEVMEKRARAEAVIFSGENTAKSLRRRHNSMAMAQQQAKSHRLSKMQQRLSRSHVDNLDLSTLPGMRAFTDRALLGLLKTFAGIHREKKILDWNNDFRLGAGVGAMSINLNFGMDAGWAVEGAVGSAYKIDATYLSPHVNMASRMMSATKQYGVYILLSQSVHKLLSENAQDKLRHIDTVTVKGSSVQQKIFTYDAKPRSDFFLYSKTESQEDLDSDRYTPAIWNVDQDLVAMRNHISDEFMDVFNRGRDEYLAGNWPLAVQLLKSADKIMFQRVVEEGFDCRNSTLDANFQQSLADLNEDDERVSMGDGPSQRIMKYIADMGGEAPSNWKGYRPLNSK